MGFRFELNNRQPRQAQTWEAIAEYLSYKLPNDIRLGSSRAERNHNGDGELHDFGNFEASRYSMLRTLRLRSKCQESGSVLGHFTAGSMSASVMI